MTNHDTRNANDLLLFPPPSHAQVLEAVNDLEWQELRLSLKGLPTLEKLEKLREWTGSSPGWNTTGSVRRMIQVHNYIGALKRGGQIAADGSIRKEC